MDDAGGVSGDQSGNNRTGDPQGFLNRQLALLLDHRGEVVALDVRHRDVLDAVDLAEIVNANDVLVRHLPRQHSSRLNRRSTSAALLGSAVTSGRMTLIATATPSSASQAWYTAPMPPTPSSRMMW